MFDTAARRDHFLKELRAGQQIAKPELGIDLDHRAAPWLPMDCGGMDLGDDFRPFVKKRLMRGAHPLPSVANYQCETNV